MADNRSKTCSPKAARGKPYGAGVHSLTRALSKLGAASRTQAAALIAKGLVTVNGVRMTDPDYRADINKDVICIDDVPVTQAHMRYLALNKPRGLVTTANDEQGRDTVYKCLPPTLQERVSPVGRLDKASEGLLLFTNDSVWADRLLDPANHLPRVYHVQVNRKPSAEEFSTLTAGVTNDSGELLRAQRVELLREGSRNCWLSITLTEGKNRQIRRMLASLDVGVLRLVRVAIGPIELGQLGKGQMRELTEQEIRALGG